MRRLNVQYSVQQFAQLVINNHLSFLLLLPGAELSLITESFGLFNYLLLPFLSILDASSNF